MAKRKRLSPAAPSPESSPESSGTAPETKSAFPRYPDGVWRPAPSAGPSAGPSVGVARAPIAGIAGEAAAVAALDEVEQGLAAARAEGRLLLDVPLAAVDETYLVRDRLALDPDEMAELTDSLRRRGQQVPIEVVDLGPDRMPRWGLISGWRRLTALRRLAAEAAPDVPDATVLAVLRRPVDAGSAYLAMVEENEVRAGLSHYERARIVARATDAGAFPDDRAALSALFAAASRPRRSKIGSFLRIVRSLDDALRFPAAIGERLGLQIAKALEADPQAEARLRAALRAAEPDAPDTPDTPQAEAAVLTKVLTAAPSDDPAKAAPPAAPASDIALAPGIAGREAGRGAQRSLVLSGPGLAAALADPQARDRLLARLRAALGEEAGGAD